jgi:hypothetical protein
VQALKMPSDQEPSLGIRYNAAVDEFQASEYPTLQGKNIISPPPPSSSSITHTL